MSPRFDSEALRAAAESAARKSQMGSNATDQLAPHGSIIVDDHRTSSDPQDLTTTYMGLSLANPLVASAGPLSQNIDGIRSLSEAGVGAIVLFSLFEEQIRHEQRRALEQLEVASESFAEALSYFPIKAANTSGLVRSYLDLVEKATCEISTPIIASLNGSVQGEWTQCAHQLQEAGAAGLELNVYYVPGTIEADGRETEQRYLDILADVKSQVTIPVAMKMSPYLSSFGQMAHRLDEAGADGLVLFNRYLQPDIDLDRMEMVSGFELSTPQEGRLPRSWIAALYSRLNASLAGTSGVETVDDVVKYLAAGADVVMATSALIRHGADYASQLIDGVSAWLKRRQMSLSQLRGILAIPSDVDAESYRREGYVSGLERAKGLYARTLEERYR